MAVFENSERTEEGGCCRVSDAFWIVVTANRCRVVPTLRVNSLFSYRTSITLFFILYNLNVFEYFRT